MILCIILVIFKTLKGIFLKHISVLVFLIFLLGCQTSNLVENVKQDFAIEKKVTVFDKSNTKSNSKIPLNGMIFVKKDETIYSIANKYKVVPKEIIEDNNLKKPYNLKPNQILFLRNKNFYVVRSGDNLDIISLIKDTFKVPTFAYQVSGEYSMLKLAINKGWLDSDVMLESLISFKRAGADAILTYAAKEISREINIK